MPNILQIAYSVEGSTDVRFLHNVIQRTFEEISMLAEIEIEVYPASNIPDPKVGNFNENVVALSIQAMEMGIQVLCIHCDADAEDEQNVIRFKIEPAFTTVKLSELDICKNLVALIPIQMSEAWMLADKELFKEEIGTTKSNAVLGIARNPETIADPKSVIEEAIRRAQIDKPKKSRNIGISDLYQPIGQKISLDLLNNLRSYSLFKTAVVQALRHLNYLN